jgi:hypothetical protein
MSPTPDHLTRCAICNGTREEHRNSQHVFTTSPGDLRPSQTPPGQQASGRLAPTQVVERLIALLLDKELITDAEALRCFGVEKSTAKLTHRPMSDGAVSSVTPSGTTSELSYAQPPIG